MIWLKCALAGLASLLAFGAIAAVVYPMILNRNSGSRGLIGVDWISLVRSSPILWLMLGLVFAAGFFWQYRRSII